MLINICIILIGLSNLGLIVCIYCINERLNKHADYILNLCNILTEVFSKEDEDAETE